MEPNEMKFRELLHLLSMVDGVDTQFEITDEEYQKLIGTVADKVDKIKFVMTKMEAEIDRLKKIEKDFTASRRAAESNLERLKSYVILQMKENGLPMIQGDKFKISLQEHDSIDVRDDLTEADYFTIGLDYPDALKREVSLVRSKVKDYLKDPEKAVFFTKYAKIVSTPHIRWGVLRKD